MKSFVRELDIDPVGVEGVKDVGCVVGGVEMENVGNVLDDISLRILSLHLDQDMFWDLV